MSWEESAFMDEIDTLKERPVYVLTRTSGRPNFFQQNRESVKAQTYSKIVHLVSYDDDETAKYVLADFNSDSSQKSKKNNLYIFLNTFFPNFFL